MFFVFIGILAGAGALALASFASGQTGNALATISNSSYGLVQFTTQLPTVGIIGGIALLILVLFVGFGAFMGGGQR